MQLSRCEDAGVYQGCGTVFEEGVVEMEMDWRIVAIPGSKGSKRTLVSFEDEN